MTKSSKSDRELLSDWRSGDETAGEQLVARHFVAVSRFLERRVDGATLEELLQATFLACVEARDRETEMTSFRAYLLGIARNKVRMHFRRAPLVARETELAEEPASSMVNYSSVVARRDEQRLLLLALGDLDEDEAIAVELHYWQGLTIVEIAEALSIPPGTVKTRLMRARKVLAKSIQRHAKSADLAQSTIGDLDRWARSLQSDGSGTGS